MSIGRIGTDISPSFPIRIGHFILSFQIGTNAKHKRQSKDAELTKFFLSSLSGRSRVGAMGGGGNKAHIAVRVTLRDMVVANNRKTAVLASRTRVGLQRYTCKTGDDSQEVFHLIYLKKNTLMVEFLF